MIRPGIPPAAFAPKACRPYRTTPEEIRVHRASGAPSLNMEAAALFAATIGWLAG